jgi:hypothetical protein
MGVKFDWSLLDRDSLARVVLALAPEIVDTRLTIDQFHNKIVNRLRKTLPIKFKKTFNCKVETNVVWVGGCYYSDKDQDKQKCIELVLEYSIFDDYIKIGRKRFKSTCYSIADTLLHEIIHMRQFRRRKFKVLPDYESTASKTSVRLEQEYLGCSDEIDAYAFNIACELMDKFGANKKAIVDYLNENQQGIRRRHNSWRMYLKAFQHDHNHPIVKKLKSKVMRYLPQAQIGKPYRNKDWIYR